MANSNNTSWDVLRVFVIWPVLMGMVVIFTFKAYIYIGRAIYHAFMAWKLDQEIKADEAAKASGAAAKTASCP